MLPPSKGMITVSFLQDVPGEGRKGEIKDVPFLYATKTLVPRRWAKIVPKVIYDDDLKKPDDDDDVKKHRKALRDFVWAYFRFTVFYEFAEEVILRSIDKLFPKEYKGLEIIGFSKKCLVLPKKIKELTPDVLSQEEKEKLLALFSVLTEIDRNQIIHQLSNNIIISIQKAKELRKQTEAWENARRIILPNFKRLRDSFEIFFSLESMPSVERSNKIFRLSKRPQTSFPNRDSPNETRKTTLETINRKLALCYYCLIKRYNASNYLLQNIIAFINQKVNIWDENTLKDIRKMTLGECYNKLILPDLKRDDPRLFRLNAYLAQIENFYIDLKDIVQDRNYWVHYFAIDYTRSGGGLILEKTNLYRKLELITRMNNSEEFTKQFYFRLREFCKSNNI